MTEAVSNEDDVKTKTFGDTETSDDFFGDGETRTSLQSVAKSSSGYDSGSSTDMSEIVQLGKSMLVYGTAAVSRSHDLDQVDETILGSMELINNCKWPYLGSLYKSHMQLLSLIELLYKHTTHMIVNFTTGCMNTLDLYM